MRSLRLIALLAIPAQFALAQQATPLKNTLTLDEAIATAQQNNPVFQQVRNNLRTANANLKAVNGALLPTASASFSTGYQQAGSQIVQGVQLQGSSDTYQSRYNLGLGYNVAPSILYLPKAARAQRDASEADISSSSEQLRSQVTTQYITALQSEALAAVLDTLVASAKGQLDLVNAKMELGAVTIVDVRAAEVAVGTAQVQSLTTHNKAQVDKLTLFQIMGVPGNLNTELTTRFPIAQPTLSLDSLISLARRVNPDLAARKSREAASEMNVKVARSAYLPSLSLSTGYGANAFGYTNSDILAQQLQAKVAGNFGNCMFLDSLRRGAGLPLENCGTGTVTAADLSAARASNKPFSFIKSPYSVSAFFSVPIFNGFQRESNIEQNRVLRDNALYDVRARTLQITTDVTQAYLTLVTATRTIELQTQIAAKAAEDLAAQQERYKVGAATFLDVTVTRATYEKAQIDRVNAIYDYHKAFAALENAVGRPLR